jgi:hypothetical protein
MSIFGPEMYLNFGVLIESSTLARRYFLLNISFQIEKFFDRRNKKQKSNFNFSNKSLKQKIPLLVPTTQKNAIPLSY